MTAQLVEFAGIRILNFRNIARVFYNRYLHPQTYSEIRHMVLPCILRRQYHSLYAAVAEAARHDNAVQPSQRFFNIVAAQALRVYPFYADMGVKGVSRMAHGLRYRQVCIVQLHILAHKPYAHFLFAPLYPLYHVLPLGKLRRLCINAQLPAHHRGKV